MLIASLIDDLRENTEYHMRIFSMLSGTEEIKNTKGITL